MEHKNLFALSSLAELAGFIYLIAIKEKHDSLHCFVACRTALS